MSYSDDTVANVWGYPEPEPRRVRERVIVSSEFWETPAEPEYLERRVNALREMYQDVSLVSIRPSYGGYLYQFWGHDGT